MRRSAICGSRRGRSFGGPLDQVAAGAGDHRRALPVHHRTDDPDPEDRGSVVGSWELIQQLGRVPRRLIWDNEPGIGRGQRRAEGVASFMGTLATKLVLLPPRDPESKGVVERRNGWFETSFMPGRSFCSPADFNTQFSDWLSLANSRTVRTLKASPVSLVEADRAAMLPLPPIPLHLGWRNKIRLGRDYYVRLDTNDYSVDPAMIGRMVEVAADLDRVRVRCEARIVAEHGRGLGTRSHRHRPRPHPCPRRDSRLVAQEVPTAPRRCCRWR